MKVLARVMLSCVLPLCGAAHSQVLYQSGFESPAYALGALGTQDGWSSQVAATVQNGTKFTGNQALQFNPSGLAGAHVTSHGVT